LSPIRKSDSIAVVGATCPLGKSLVESLLAAGFFVHGFYRSTNKVPLSWKKHPAFQGNEFDLTNAAALAEALETSNKIVWLAHSRNVPATDLQDLNEIALAAVCGRTVRDHRKIVLLSSGGAIYGNPVFLPVSEDHPCRPLSAYGESKRKLEETLRAGVECKAELSGVVLRCGNIYGPNYLASDAPGCIGAFTRAILTHQPVTLVAGGKAVRDLVHVDDVSRAILSAIMSDHIFAAWNVGCGVGTQISHALEMICEILDCAPTDFIHVDAPPTDVKEIVLNIERINRDCSWRPRIGLRQGLESMLIPLRGMELIPNESFTAFYRLHRDQIAR
jgi:UDP-glucose 4-epimerase